MSLQSSAASLPPARCKASACWALVACLLPASSWADAPAPDLAAASYETRFMEGMIDHHAMAVEMSETCVEKAVHPELGTLCEQIVAAQESEIGQMQSWLQAWYEISYEPEMKPGEMRRMESLASLSGADYEIRFLESMIRHHRTAVVEGAQCMDRAYHEELVALCEDIVATQSEEIQRMRSWLCDWYGRCRPGSAPA